LIRDTSTLAQLLGHVTGDLIKIGLSSLAAAAVGLATGASVILGSSAVIPLMVAIAVGVATGYALGEIDKKFGATKALIKAYENIGLDLDKIKWEFNRTMYLIENEPGFAEGLFAPCGNRY